MHDAETRAADAVLDAYSAAWFDRQEAVDRLMDLLAEGDRAEGEPGGVIAWALWARDLAREVTRAEARLEDLGGRLAGSLARLDGGGPCRPAFLDGAHASTDA